MSSRDLFALIADELDIETLMESAFNMYKNTKDSNDKYNSYDNIPQNLIKLYYSEDTNHSSFSSIIESFKEKYIKQESLLEGVHTIEEINGLGEVYDYIRSDEWQKCANIYIILVINSKLFSLTPYPEYGGQFRNNNCFIGESDVQTTPYFEIPQKVQTLWQEFDSLMKFGLELNNNKENISENEIIEYINDCLKLKCKLIEIHPFSDGNGRTMRALVNLLFKIAGLPPVYVKRSERKKYIEAMEKAIVEKEYNVISKFYYYKICDSIIELDISQRRKKGTPKTKEKIT